jgi:hypothetical protein
MRINVYLLVLTVLVPTTSKNAKLVSYADDTSLIVTGPNSVEFCTEVNTVFADINE